MSAVMPSAERASQDPSLAAPLTPLAQDSLAVLVTSLAGRLNRGATNFYQRHFNLAVADYRVLVSLGRVTGLNVGEVATEAEVDKAAASRSLRLLQLRGLVHMEQTQTRGRAARVQLTEAGRELERRLRTAARHREERFVGALDPAERTQVADLLKRLIANVPVMNAD